ncbi:hypothetical protein [Prauserella shujinwangii]|nr:hypothetical protein [Prauserella shujinwangii]
MNVAAASSGREAGHRRRYLALGLVAEVVASTPVAEFVEQYEKARG